MPQVSDYDIANASGASVRSELNQVLDAIKTCNSGSNDPSNAQTFMLYGDSADNNTLKIRNGANNNFTVIGSVDSDHLGLMPRSGGSSFPMTGQLFGDDGSVANAPAYAFDQDSDTGMFRKSANKLGFACAGTEIGNFENAGLLINATGSAARGVFFNDANNSHHVALSAPSTVPSNITLNLPTTIVDGGFLGTDSSGNLTFQIIAGVPTGAIFALPNDAATNQTGYQNNGIPNGYLECAGQAVSRNTYAVLFAVLGTKYGAGNGTTTFNLPDLRGEFIRGYDHGRGVDAGRPIGGTQAAANHAHFHSVSGTTSHKSLTGNVSKISETFEVSGTTAGVFAKQSASGQRTPITSDFSGAGQFSIDVSHSHTYSANTNSIGSEARPRNIAMMYIIKI